MSYRVQLSCGDVLFNDSIRGETPRMGDKLILTGMREPLNEKERVHIEAGVIEVRHHLNPTEAGFTSKPLVMCTIGAQEFEWLKNTCEWTFVEL